MVRRIELDFHRSAGRLIPEGSSVLAAVSGGGDSVALLHLLVRYARGRNVALTVGHLDHGLRRGSRADRKFVEKLARELSLPCLSDRRQVAALRRKGESPEEAARRVRRAFLLEAAARAGAGLIATGHTLDDQAETVLMRLVRGAGAKALTGMAESGPGPFVRPLLEIERDRLRAYLDRRGLDHREDPSNRDMRFDRNRVRRLVLPVLREALNPQAARHLVKAARRFREDASFLDELAEQSFERALRKSAEGRLELEAAALAEAPPPIANRVARRALLLAGADARRLATRHIDGLIGLAGGPGGRELHLPGPLVARRLRKLIHISYIEEHK
jgi:tRNA(Ile)-lysidine synthase